MAKTLKYVELEVSGDEKQNFNDGHWIFSLITSYVSNTCGYYIDTAHCILKCMH